MSDSDNEKDEAGGIDKEQLRRIEQNDIKTNKKDKRKKRLENKGIKVNDSDSDVSLQGGASDNEASGDDEPTKKKRETERPRSTRHSRRRMKRLRRASSLGRSSVTSRLAATFGLNSNWTKRSRESWSQTTRSFCAVSSTKSPVLPTSGSSSRNTGGTRTSSRIETR